MSSSDSAAPRLRLTAEPYRRRARRLGSRWWYALLCTGSLAFLIVVQLTRIGEPPARWDWLMHSGVVLFLIALGAARRIPPAVPLTVRRLRLVDVAGVEGEHTDAVLAALDGVRHRYAKAGAVLGLVVMGMFWFWAQRQLSWWNVLYVLELGAAALAGWVVGGFIAYGRLGNVLAQLELRPLVLPGHPDGAAGLKPVGELYLRQALIVALIGVFAGVWWLLFPTLDRYGNWRDPYLGIVLVCVVLEAAALFLPLRFFHRQMERERTELLLRDAATAARQIAQIDAALADADPEAIAGLEAERERALARWQAIDTMPTWPVDVQIRKRFAWSNLAMLVPVVLQILNAPQILQQISSALSGL